MKTNISQSYVGQIKDLVSFTSPHKDPFLYYLPELIDRNVVKDLNQQNLLRYAQIAVNQDKSDVLLDGLRILNQLVEPNDGSIKPPSPSFFFNNHSFSWTELGGHQETLDVIAHIINKTIFTYSLG